MQALRWTLELASSEFDVHRSTLTKRLKANSEEPGDDGKFSTAQIFKAVAGDMESERIGLIAAQRRGQEIKNAEAEDILIPLAVVIKFCEKVAVPIRQRIISSGLTEEERHDALAELVRLREVDWPKEVRDAERG